MNSICSSFQQLVVGWAYDQRQYLLIITFLVFFSIFSNVIDILSPVNS